MSVVARLNFVSLYQPLVMYAVKELMRKMTNPTKLDEIRFKMVLRFMSNQPRKFESSYLHEVPNAHLFTIYL